MVVDEVGVAQGGAELKDQLVTLSVDDYCCTIPYCIISYCIIP